MSDETSRTSAIRNYLLGDLPESESEEIERWYFGAGRGVDEVWAVFGEIAEEYLSGDLSESESRRFEQKLRSSPALREMFENEKALHDYAARNTSGAPREVKTDNSTAGGRWKWPPPAAFFKPTRLMAAVIIAMISLGALVTWFGLRTREGVNPATLAQLPNVPPQNTAKDQKSPESATQPSVDPQRPHQSRRNANDKLATFLLLAAGTRGGQSDPPTLEIPARTDIVQLELELPNDNCAEFSAVLRTESNEELQRWGNLRARRDPSTLSLASLRVRADSLKNTGYVIRLDCVSPHKNLGASGEYRFKTEKK